MDCSTVRRFDVVLSSDVLDPHNPALADLVGSDRGLVVMDGALGAAYRARLDRYLATRLPGFHVLSLAVSEQHKTMGTVLDICAAAQDAGLARREVLVALGGGVCCDLVSVAATLVRRGLPYVTVPTTLVAQVDAGIGLKGAVNFGGGKNYLGCFTPPAGVLVDPDFLRTVQPPELVSGLAEMVKIGLVRDADLVAALTAHGGRLVASGFTQPAGLGARLIARSIQLMLEELAADPYEEFELRRLADFGHTFSGRLEELSGYALRHGEAVAIDMALSSAVACETGHLTDAALAEILSVLLHLGLPITTDLATEASLLDAMRATARHRAGALNLVVPTAVGAATFLPKLSDVDVGTLARARRRIDSHASAQLQPAPLRPAPLEPAPSDLRPTVGLP
jgi:2-epi-5-epi-valiolone synthase